MSSRHGISRRQALALLGAGAFLSPACGSEEPSPKGRGTGEAVHYLSLLDVARRIAAHEVSPVEVTTQMLERITALDGRHQSFATILAEEALDEARMAERRIAAGDYLGPLHGIPVAVTDLCHMNSVRTMSGSAVRRSDVPEIDATVVARLRAAGAVLIGKLNVAEGGMAGYPQGLGVPANPWSGDNQQGASPSGAGAAVAAGFCFAAVGTDTGGAIRSTASAHAIVGLKPTYGRISRFGVEPLSDSLDHVGPLARRAGDLAAVYDAIAGFDPRDRSTLSEQPERALGARGQGIKGLRLGIDRGYAFDGVDRGEAAAIERALALFAGNGAEVVEVRMPDLTGLADSWMTIAGVEARAAHAATFPSRAGEYSPQLRDFLDTAAHVTDAQAAEARRRSREFTSRFSEVLARVDAIVCPGGGVAEDAARFMLPASVAGTPAICLPSGFSPENLPYGIQLVGPRLSEATLCRIASAYEAVTDWHTRHPPV